MDNFTFKMCAKVVMASNKIIKIVLPILSTLDRCARVVTLSINVPICQLGDASLV
jgi:hypothetical protein